MFMILELLACGIIIMFGFYKGAEIWTDGCIHDWTQWGYPITSNAEEPTLNRNRQIRTCKKCGYRQRQTLN